jgi:CheY-like chemotaxis protein
MPELDGFEATRQIRRAEAGGTRHLPIVAMTADARTEDHEHCLRAGMDDFVSKPTSLEGLRVVLDRWLPTPERRQSNRNRPAASSSAMPGAAQLLELCGGDRDAVITLLGAAAGSVKADFARIESAAAANDFGTVAEAAHRLTATAASIRSPRLGEISAAIERAASTAAASIPPALLAKLGAAIGSFIGDLEEHGTLLTTMG